MCAHAAGAARADAAAAAVLRGRRVGDRCRRPRLGAAARAAPRGRAHRCGAPLAPRGPCPRPTSVRATAEGGLRARGGQRRPAARCGACCAERAAGTCVRGRVSAACMCCREPLTARETRRSVECRGGKQAGAARARRPASARCTASMRTRTARACACRRCWCCRSTSAAASAARCCRPRTRPRARATRST